jgi:hypothetical protein
MGQKEQIFSFNQYIVPQKIEKLQSMAQRDARR